MVSLSRARKAKARADDKARADANAVKFGRSKAAKARDKVDAEKALRDLDGHLRE